MKTLEKALKEQLKEFSRGSYWNFRKELKEIGITSAKGLVEESQEIDTCDTWSNLHWDAGYISGLKFVLRMLKERKVKGD